MLPSRHLLMLALAATAMAAPPFESIARIRANGAISVAATGSGSDGSVYFAGATIANDLPGARTRRPGGSTLIRVTASGSEFIEVPFAESPTCILSDPATSNLLYLGGARFHRSDDSGVTWTTSSTGIDEVLPCIAIARAEKRLIALFDSGATYASEDDGVTWTQQGTAGSVSSANIVVDPYTPSNIFIVGGDSYRSTDGGRTWARVEPTIVRLVFDPQQKGRAWALDNNLGRPAQTLDSGDTWNRIDFFESVFAATNTTIGRSLHLIRSDAGFVLYIDGFRQDYRSTDRGETWQILRDRGDSINMYTGPSGDALYGIGTLEITRSRDFGETWQTVFADPTAIRSSILSDSSDLILTRPATSDAYVMKFRSTGEPLWSTYIGGTDHDSAVAIAEDESGFVYVAGNTCSADFPRTAGTAFRFGLTLGCAPFLTKLSADGQRVLYSYVIGSSPAQVTGIAVDRQGSVTMSGWSFPGHPTTSGAWHERFVAGTDFFPTNGVGVKLDPLGTRIVYSTYLYDSASPEGGAFGVTLDFNGNPVFAGKRIFKLDSNGSQLLWMNSDLFGYGIVNGPEGDWLVAGAVDYKLAAERETPYGKQYFHTRCRDSSGALRVMDANNLAIFRVRGDTGETSDCRLIAHNGTLNGISWDSRSGTLLVTGVARDWLDSVALLQGIGPTPTAFAALLDGSLTIRESSFLGGFYSTPRLFVVNLVRAVGANNNVVEVAQTVRDLNEPGFDWARYALARRDARPRIDKVESDATGLSVPAAPNLRMRVRGEGFSSDSTITIGDRSVTVLAVSPTELQIELPDALPRSADAPLRIDSVEVSLYVVPLVLEAYQEKISKASAGAELIVPVNGVKPGTPLGFTALRPLAGGSLIVINDPPPVAMVDGLPAVRLRLPDSMAAGVYELNLSVADIGFLSLNRATARIVVE